MKLLYTVLVFLFISLNSDAFNGTNNILIEFLLKGKKEISYISWSRENFFSTGDSTFDTYPQNLIKTKDDLFVFINGSGRIYKVSKDLNGLSFSRIDSTSHFGYNIGSFGFNYREKLYSLGGYGFWRMNGQLRVFNEQEKEWDIIKLNKEIPFITGLTEGLLWYDTKNEKFYSGFYIHKDEAVKSNGLGDSEYIYEVMLLDLKGKLWNKIGDLNLYIQKKIQQIKPITMSPWGQLVLIGEKINLLDFKNNKILSLNINHTNYQTIIRSHWGSVFYFSDSTLIFANKNKIDSVKFKYSDFKNTNEPLFTKASSDGYKFLTAQNISYLFILISMLLLSYIYFLRKRINLKNGNDNFVLKSASEPQTLFDELEIQLLELLIRNTESGKTTTTDEQNKVLGLSKKNSEIQKKQRSDIIVNINKKFAFITKNKEPIIQKRRTDIDKRAFEYFLDYSRIKELKSFINTNQLHV